MKPQENTHKKSGVVNYFQGATINNLVINGDMVKSGPDQFNNPAPVAEAKHKATVEEVTEAVQQCGKLIWGNAALAVVFCACRDLYKWEDNASLFERRMGYMGIDCPAGTIANAMRNNPYMKLPVRKWKDNGAMERAMRLVEEFEKELDAQGNIDKEPT